jgi:hypothetical protein
MIIIAFLLGIIFGILLVPHIAHAFYFMIKVQMKVFNRQCRILYILRTRYKSKLAIKLFNKGNKQYL